MIYLSASMIRDYLICPKRAFFRINYSDSAVQNPAQIAGILVHELLHKNFKEPKEIVLGLAEMEIQLKGLYSERTKILSCIDNYYTMFGTMAMGEGQEELYFKLPYSEDVVLTGRIDKIYGESIYDWKTSAEKLSSISGDVQMLMYYLAYKKIFGTEPKGMFYVSLSIPTIYEFIPLPEYVQNFENGVIPYVIDGLRKKEYSKLGIFEKSKCFRCNFASICREG